MRRSLFVLGCVTESAAGRRRSRGSLLRAGADLGARVQLGDRLLDVARVRGAWRELQVLLVRPAGGLLIVAHEVRDAEPAPGHRKRAVVGERLLELLRRGLVAAAFQLEVAAFHLRLGDGAGELGWGLTGGGRGILRGPSVGLAPSGGAPW